MKSQNVQEYKTKFAISYHYQMGRATGQTALLTEKEFNEHHDPMGREQAHALPYRMTEAQANKYLIEVTEGGWTYLRSR